jgi:RNA polymerase sigma factor (sigma-70 family)
MAIPKLQRSENNSAFFNEFEEVYQQYHKAVYTNIFKVVKDNVLAEDVFQDVFMTLWEHLTTKDEKQSIASWLFVVSHNKAKACLKKRISESLIFVDNYTAYENKLEYLAEDKLKTEEQLIIIQNAVQHLSARRKQVFTLNKFEGKSVDEIAEQLSTTPATVKEYLKQSVRLVRSHIVKEKGYAEGAALVLCMIEAVN